PVVRDSIVVIGRSRGRPLPEIVIESRRRVGLFANPQCWPVVVVPASRAVYVSNDSFMQFGDGFHHAGSTPPLHAHLDGPFMLPSRRDHLFPFPRIVATRFFNIDMLARGAP